MVVTKLKNEMNRGDFFMTLRNQPVALSLYKQVILIFNVNLFSLYTSGQLWYVDYWLIWPGK